MGNEGGLHVRGCVFWVVGGLAGFEHCTFISMHVLVGFAV